VNAKIASAFILLSLGATVATAQQPVLNDRVAKSMPGKYSPACNIKPSLQGEQRRVVLKTISRLKCRRTRPAQHRQKVLLEAMQQNG
jgi:hypothetical protein